MRALVGDARVVAIGEAAHNVTELYELKDQLLRLLVEEFGFTAFVTESGFAEGLGVDEWIRGGPGTVEQIARDGITYHFGECVPMRRQLQWMRERGVRFYGMDLPGSSTSPGPAVRACLTRVAPRPGDAELAASADLGGRSEAAVRWERMPVADRIRLLDGVEGLAVRADESGDAVAARCAASLRAFVAELSAPVDGPYPREAFMADTVSWVAAREPRIVVSAHNGHLRRTDDPARPTVGDRLAAAFGPGLVTIGTGYDAGPVVRIVERSRRPFDWTVSLESGAVVPEAGEFDLVVQLPHVTRVPGAFERLRDDIAGHRGPAYPASRTVDAVEDVAGVRVPDPYRWLEEETDEVHRWQDEQAGLATAVAYERVDAEAIRALVETYDRGARPGLPRYGAGRWWRSVGSAVVVADEPFGDGRAVVDLTRFGERAVLSWLAPSPDGRVLAIGVCTDGSENNTIRLVDVATGQLLDGAPPQVLHSAWAGGAMWRPDSSGFSFFALTGSVAEFRQAVFFHRLGGPTELEPVPVPAGSREYTVVQFSRDGRWAVAAHRVGSPVPVAVRDLSAPGTGWRPFVTTVDGTVAGHVVGDRYVAVTDVGAPRGRVVAIPLDAAEPDDPASWIELVPEGDTVLRSVLPVGEQLYVSEFDAAYARVRVFDAAGVEIGEVPLPGRGALAVPFFPLMSLPVGEYADEFVFAFSTPVTSWGVYSHRPGAASVETLLPPAVTLDAEVVDGWATAPDGVRVPYEVVRARDVVASGPAATLISAYGAANVPTLPQYQPDAAAFVAAGGVFVSAHLRGGGEYGRDWYLAAHRERRHVRDSDLVAVAEHLIAEGLTSPDRLALTGGSDGGLMCGVAVTRRPDLWRAVLPRAPLLDLIGGLRDPYLDFVIRKAWADPDDPDEVRRLLGLSPYQLVEPADYPAVYVQAGATDPRCRPWHARKFVARLQAAQRGAAPILLHVYGEAGHGAATDPDIAREQDAEWLAFLTGTLDLPASGRRAPGN